MKNALILLTAAALCLSACTATPHSAQRLPRINAHRQTPIVRIFELVVKPEHLDEFHRLGRHNISQSVNTEAGVLAMYVLADKQTANKLYIVEAYTDEEAYQAHRQTPHFQAWLNGSKEMIVSRTMIDTLPVVFGAKAGVFE